MAYVAAQFAGNPSSHVGGTQQQLSAAAPPTVSSLSFASGTIPAGGTHLSPTAALSGMQPGGTGILAAQKPVGTMSEMNTSVGGETVSRAQLGFERRLAWLEEDVSVLHRRLRDECGEGGIGLGNASGDQGLRALVARLDGELAAERRAREAMEARVLGFEGRLEGALAEERTRREEQLRNVASDLESTIGSLLSRIDGGFPVSTASLRSRAEEAEARLRTNISRVTKDLSTPGGSHLNSPSSRGAPTPAERAVVFEGPRGVRSPARHSLSPGTSRQSCYGFGATSPTSAAAGATTGLATSQLAGTVRENHSDGLSQDVTSGRGFGQQRPQQQQQQQQRQLERMPSSPVASSRGEGRPPAISEESVESYDQVRQESTWVRERRERQQRSAAVTPGTGATPAATPSLAYPSTLQVPGSGLGQGLLPGAAASGTASASGLPASVRQSDGGSSASADGPGGLSGSARGMGAGSPATVGGLSSLAGSVRAAGVRSPGAASGTGFLGRGMRPAGAVNPVALASSLAASVKPLPGAAISTPGSRTGQLR